MLKTASPGPIHTVCGESRTVAELFRRRCAASGPDPAIYQRERAGGPWVCTTWSEFFDQAARAAQGLADLGLQPGERAAILGPTRRHWCVFDMAAQLAGLVSYGVYPLQTPEQVRYLLEHSDARVIFVDGEVELATVLAAAADGAAPQLQAIVPWTDALYRAHAASDPRIVDPARFQGAPMDAATIRARGEARLPEDTAILVYTSGTTGPPKGAMISHRNIVDVLRAYEGYSDLRRDDLSLSFLPMAHVAERILAFYSRINAGVATAYATSVAAVLPELSEVQPTLFGSVPRIFEKAHARIQAEISRRPPAVAKIFAAAVAAGRERARRRLAGERVPLGVELRARLADRLFFRKIRAVFGGRVRMMVTGAAPTDRAILEFFWAVGLPIYELYGMTEATVVTHVNVPGHTRLGTVGRALPGIECRIADDGEILIRGPVVFKGYFKDPEASARAVIDGWLHTGDVGVVDADGYLTLKDRKKHLIITAGGKNLAPANLEGALKPQDPLISHVHAHGDRRPYVVAIVACSPLETLE
ncbi:MAG: long-chain fatty acid--CoA ligase, partial [Nannocystaceae bacterium]